MKITFYNKDKVVLIVEALSVHDGTWVAKTKGIIYDDYKIKENN